jgi:hypothetical protein
VNIALGREEEFKISPAGHPKKVAIVGVGRQVWKPPESVYYPAMTSFYSRKEAGRNAA